MAKLMKKDREVDSYPCCDPLTIRERQGIAEPVASRYQKGGVSEHDEGYHQARQMGFKEILKIAGNSNHDERRENIALQKHVSRV